MIEKLTDRQIEVLVAYCKTGTRDRAAHSLGISTHTLRNHLEYAYRNLEVFNILDAIRVLGWLNLPEDGEEDGK